MIDNTKKDGAGLVPVPPSDQEFYEEEAEYYESWSQSFEDEKEYQEWLNSMEYFLEKGRTFDVEVLAEVELCTSMGIERHVKLELHFIYGQNKIISIPFPEIDSIKWFEIDKRCIISPFRHKAGKCLALAIKLSLSKARKQRVLLLDRPGIFNIGGRIIYVAGDKIIGNLSERVIIEDEESIHDVDLAPLPFKLDIDLKLTIQKAFDGMRELICLSRETGRPIVAHVISGITRTAFKDAGMTPCAVLVIVGKTGSLKTHYVPHLAQLYDRANGIKPDTRFNSTLRYIEDTLYETCEFTKVIDDISTAASAQIKRTNEHSAEEIIRRVSDDTGRGRMEGKTMVQRDFRGNVIFIGEYSVGKESSVPRALVVNITSPPDGRILDKYQRQHPLLVSTFYYYFIEWYVANYYDIVAELDARFTKLRSVLVKGTHGRLRDTQFYLQTAYMLFLQFCEDSGFITADEAQEDYLDFGRQLAGLIEEQHKRANPDKEESKKIIYMKLIRKLYRNDSIRYADNKKQFIKNPDKYDGLIHYGCLCLRRDKLEKRLRDAVSEAKIDDAIHELVDRNALKLVQEKYQVKISGITSNFYAIWLEMLNDQKP